MVKLGRLTKVKDLRQVWNNESRDFTPWLAKEENLNILADEIGLDIELIETESKAGSFSIDILAKDIDDKYIIIENQLEETNHNHLGQSITYASVKDAKTIIWIVKDVRDEHRKAVDWLNEHTDEEINIFLIKIELWKIDDSNIAPKFNIISSPNNWAKTVKNSQNPSTDSGLKRLEYWTNLLDYLNNEDTPFNTKRKPDTDSWYSLPSGSSLFRISFTINSSKKFISTQIYIRKDKDLYDYLHSQKEEIEKEMEMPLNWMRLNNRKASRIELKHENIDPLNEENWDKMIEMQVNDAIKLYDVFKDRVNDYMND